MRFPLGFGFYKEFYFLFVFFLNYTTAAGVGKLSRITTTVG